MRALCSFARVDGLTAMVIGLCDLEAGSYKALCWELDLIVSPRIYVWEASSSVAVFRCSWKGAWWEVVGGTQPRNDEFRSYGIS